MGLNAHVLDLIATHCRHAGFPGRALAAGYPDVLVSDADLDRIFGTPDFPPDSEAEKIRELHRITFSPRDPHAIFRALGYHLAVVDIHAERGGELIRDLNEPVELGQFDLVLDHGTAEHCFNIAQAARNLANAVKLGGFMVQHLPLSMFNHGFYNLNPAWFHAFYEHAGFEIRYLMIWHPSRGEIEAPAYKRFFGVPENSLITMLAQRMRNGEPGYPAQPIYRS